MNNNYLENRTTNRPRPEYNVGYVSNSIHSQNNRVISGYFPKANSIKAKAREKINNTLCSLLIIVFAICAISYYFVVASEIKLNDCSRKTAKLNIENAELQNELDKKKSFNNVDLTMTKNNLLQRPEKVIEATEVNTNTPNHKDMSNRTKPKAWTLGY